MTSLDQAAQYGLGGIAVVALAYALVKGRVSGRQSSNGLSFVTHLSTLIENNTDAINNLKDCLDTLRSTIAVSGARQEQMLEELLSRARQSHTRVIRSEVK